MIIDPCMNGATIWHSGEVTFIKGTPYEVAKELYSRIMYKYYNPNKHMWEINQIHPVGLEIVGNGKEYASAFDKLGIEYKTIIPKSLDSSLPKIFRDDENVVNRNELSE